MFTGSAYGTARNKIIKHLDSVLEDLLQRYGSDADVVKLGALITVGDKGEICLTMQVCPTTISEEEGGG